MSRFASSRARGVRYHQLLRFEELESRCMLSLTGDAPNPPYPTATHTSSSSTQLGASQTVDSGVVIGSIRVGQLEAEISVNVQGAAGRLDAWIDFNRDGSFSGPWEQIFNNEPLGIGIDVQRFDVPSWADIGSTWARFRISTAGNLGIGGSAPDGEVEDYQITIMPPSESLGTFGSQNIVHDATGTATATVPTFVADFDGDGDTDIVSASSSDDVVAWHRNNGDGTFNRFTIGSANDPRSVFAADVDGDGNIDVLAVSAINNAVYWYQNDGTPTTGAWARSTISNTASGARSVVAVDVDRDGDIDAVAASYLSDKIVWYENDGSQNFTERVVNVPDNDTNSGNGNGDVDGPSAVFAADINRDGHLDIVSASSVDGQLAWFQNDGSPANGGWTRRVIKNGGAATADPQELSIVVADMNGDGNVDVVAANYAEDRIAWFENDGTPTAGTWTRRDVSTAADGASGVFAADVDSDGDIDVLSASVLDDKIALYKNNGNGIVFDPVTISTAANGATSVFAADLNNDGDLDVISGSRLDNKVAWYSNQNTPGIAIAQTDDPLQVSEAGTTATFTVALASQPTSDVVLEIRNGDDSEISLSHTMLAFTSADWKTPRTVTVTGLNDSFDDGDLTTAITIRVIDDLSDNVYDKVPSEQVMAVTTDDDTAGFTVTQTDGTTQVGEGGASDTFSVVLTSRPTSNVVLQVFGNDPGEATASVASLTFTPANWQLPKTVTVTGTNDPVVDGTQMSTIFIRVNDGASDNTYDPLPDKTVTVATTDNDVADFVITQSDGMTQVNENESTDTFTAVLGAQPGSNVVLTILNSDAGEATVSATSLTFTPANWSTPQTVTVTGVNDSLVDGSQTATITIRVNDASSDNFFDSLPDKTVSVAVADNDTSPLGDYDRDGTVEMTDDFNLWRRNFGSTVAASDGNKDGQVDVADYVLWRKLLGTSGIFTAPPGDYDHDGTVEMTDDYHLWRLNFGSTVAAIDGNKDGKVDVADYVVWRKTAGTSGIPGSGSGGGGDASSNEALSASTLNGMTVEDPARVESEAASMSGAEVALSAIQRSRRGSIKFIAQRNDWQEGVFGGRLRWRDLAAALAGILPVELDEFGKSRSHWQAALPTDAAFECDDVLVLAGDLFKEDVGF